MSAVYIESRLDNIHYCKTNGQFTKHLRKHNLTYQQYYEQHVTGVLPKCYCGQSLTFYQKTETYASSCGDPICVGKSVSITKQALSLEVKQIQSQNYKKAHRNKTKEQYKKEKEKAAETYFKNYGTTRSNSPSQKAKSSATKLIKYGDSKFNNSVMSQKKNKNKTVDEKNTINAARRRTNLERYGSEHPFAGNLIASGKGNALVKEYKFESGRIVGLRGYEPQVLDYLLSIGYTETELVLHDNFVSTCFTFDYVAVNRHNSKYYPDIYIPKENKIIEVKSRWWWDGNGTEKYKSRLENNLRKRQAVIKAGHSYEVWLFNSKKNYRILKDDTDF